MGFGTGQHPTTFLCLKHMVHENLEGKRIVDVGAGSGILGAGALLSGAQWADFIEIDEMAIESCRETLELNGLEEKAAIYLTDILKDSNFFQGQKYDLGFMNIIAEVIIRVLELDWIATVPVWYLSGIIREKKQQVTDKVKEIGYSIVNEEDLGEWVFLKIKKGGL
jgi:ribosomal protein L11 methyltransferase